MKHRKKLSFALQDLAISKKFPSFRMIKNQKGIFWLGELQPSEDSPIYKVKVEFDEYFPNVFVVDPQVLRQAPHRYRDGSLCLYYPCDKSFKSDLLIADTIIPWAAEWLYFYNIWLEEGVWWGKEAPHNPPLLKRRERK